MSENDIISMALANMNSNQGAPQPQPQQQQGDPIRSALTASLKPKSELSPLKIDPKMGKTGAATNVGALLLNMFVPGVGAVLQSSIKQHKEQQINQVVNDFTILHNAWEEAQQMSGGDAEKAKQMFGQDPRVAGLFGDKKKMKLLSKAFGIDLMNPEKTTNNVAFQGLQRFLQLKDAKGKTDAIRSMMQGAQGMKQGAAQATGQPQPQQGAQGQQGAASPQDLAQNFLKMWPTQTKQPSVADAEKAALTQKNLVETAIAGEPKTEFQAWYQAKRKEGPVTADMVEAHHEASKLKPQDMLISEAIDDIQNGDVEAGKQKIDLVHSIAQATHPVGHKNFIDLIAGANAGNKEDAKNLKTYMSLQDEMRESYGRGRARYQYMAYQFPDGTIRPMSGLDMFDYIRQHPDTPPPIPSGRLTSAQEISIQQLNTEAGPTGSQTYKTGALKGVYDNLKAYDNAKDRAIFAHALNRAEHSSDWLATMKNVLTQVEVGNLSPEGKNLYVNLQRLSETMGRFRASMGLPSTDQSMSLSLALLPGPATPDQDTAKMMLDNLNQMIKQATVPALGGAPNKPTKKKTLDELLK